MSNLDVSWISLKWNAYFQKFKLFLKNFTFFTEELLIYESSREILVNLSLVNFSQINPKENQYRGNSEVYFNNISIFPNSWLWVLQFIPSFQQVDFCFFRFQHFCQAVVIGDVCYVESFFMTQVLRKRKQIVTKLFGIRVRRQTKLRFHWITTIWVKIPLRLKNLIEW